MSVSASIRTTLSWICCIVENNYFSCHYIIVVPAKKALQQRFCFLLEEVEWERLLQEFTIIFPEGKTNQRVGEGTNKDKYERAFRQEVVKRRNCSWFCFFPYKDFQNR